LAAVLVAVKAVELGLEMAERMAGMWVLVWVVPLVFLMVA
jgi:hypothetical protein